LELIHFLEEVHHPLEEEVLFPVLSKTSWLCQGGPRCSLHMGIRIEQDPLGKIEKHLADFSQKSGWRANPSQDPSWLSQQSPLSIPMEEHAVSHRLADALKELRKDRESALYREFFPLLYNDFCQLLKMHIDKEDHCLFVMCEMNLK